MSSTDTKTRHGAIDINHSFFTPHRMPGSSTRMLELFDNLSTLLYPTGRAWYRQDGNNLRKFHEAINVSFARLMQEAKLLIDQTLPDNENFSEQDAALWEYRLGLITNEEVDLELRKLAIKRKLGHPNNIKSRQAQTFIEYQLQLNGFDVYVHENTAPYQTPEQVSEINLLEVQHGEPTQHGLGTQHGGDGFDVIANSTNEIESFSIGEDNLWATFFIGGENLGDTAEVPYSRLKEFKELVIKLKPAHTVAFTFINYT